MFFSMLTLFAQEAGAAAGAVGEVVKEEQTPLLLTLMPFIAIGLLFYFLMFRPQQKQRAERKSMISTVKKNDRVLTIGGIYGTVTNVQVEDDRITIRVDETAGTKLDFSIGAVARVLRDEDETGS